MIETDAHFGRVLVDQLGGDGYPAELARSASDARFLAAVRPPRLLLLGQLDTPRGTLDLLESIRSNPPESVGGLYATLCQRQFQAEPARAGTPRRRTGLSLKAIRRLQATGLIYTAGRSEANYHLFD
ncbi:MAG: hypothetical protein ACRDJX_11475 [Solirubrobacteraceae bacterium]